MIKSFIFTKAVETYIWSKKEQKLMRVLFAVLLSFILSLNLFLYSDDIYGYSAGITNESSAKKIYTDSLKKLGYYKSDFKDEQLNYKNAILHFQSDSNITADGIAGKGFRAALIKRLQLGKVVKYKDYVKTPASSKVWITVNKSNRILTVYQNKKSIKKYPVALGRTDFVTPEGRFTIKMKVVNPEWSGGGYTDSRDGGSKDNPLGYRWLGLNIGTKNKYGIHGNNNPYSIGKNVSRGCIRMLNLDVAELYRYVKKGTPVWIGSDKVLKKWGVYQNSYVQ